MHSLLVNLLFSVLLAAVEAKEMVSVRDNRKYIMEELLTNCDKNIVEYFRQVPNTNLHTFHVAKLAPTFTISVTVRTVKSQRVMYKLPSLNGCLFLNNPIMSKAFDKSYRHMVVNNSFFKCPILPKVYFVKGLFHPNVVPGMHPPGHFNITVRLQTPQSVSSYVMELILRYSVIILK